MSTTDKRCEITDIETRRVRPRQFRHFGRLKIKPGLQAVVAKTGEPYTFRVGLDDVSVKRSCRKDGRPLGPWLFIVGDRTYSIKGDEQTCERCGHKAEEPVTFGTGSRVKVYCTECTCRDCGVELTRYEEQVCSDCMDKWEAEQEGGINEQAKTIDGGRPTG